MVKEIIELLQSYKQTIPQDPSVNILDSGMIDSFDIVNIVGLLEMHFQIDIEAEDILPENFKSVDAIENLMKKYSKI